MSTDYEPEVRDRLIEHLREFVTPRRWQRMQSVLEDRTRWITLAIEDVYQPHNASAVLRSCECFGIQDVHIVEDRNVYEVNRDVALGAAQWLNLVRHRSEPTGTAIEACCCVLSQGGYRLVAATPGPDAVSLDDLDVDAGPLAVLFGTELGGLTPQALTYVHEKVRIPMFGFTESFNISVSAALVLRELTRRLRRSDVDWRLTESERQELRLRWLRQSVNKSQDLIERFLDSQEGEAA
ncbi:MAG: RNA methyltransferase [Candidatus Latescibacterota bacterium]|nr:RNA methyltransferase [Candidatus Latescibacterota bacterium]